MMPSPFTLCIIVLVALAVFGLPIGLSMIGASVFYLLVSGLDQLRALWIDSERTAASYGLQGLISGIDWARNRGEALGGEQ